ncbi:MAG: adenylosuccinate lyase [Anaerolineae bacterium]|nr:adenylosuccinate lyase [Anaerolineae bacterium]MDW7991355.1 adenylosuccinate lyase [Anaerolineae bacterium]
MFDHETYLSPFTWRYGSAEMRRIWSEAHRRRLLRRVWVALARAQADLGLISPQQVADLEAHQDDIDIARAEQIEAEIHHDLMAELRTFAEQCPVGGPILHLGATSQDILDNADALRLREALTLVRQRLADLLSAFADRIEETADLVCMGYTHLQAAEPTTVGYRLAQYAQDLLADLEAVERMLRTIRGKGFKGAVGTAASYEQLLRPLGRTAEEMEQRAMAYLGLEAYPVTTQVCPRRQDWEVLVVLAGIAQSLHRFAMDLRLLQSPLAGEWSEPFGRAQVGSSAMPFKRNPIQAENICSLARYVAALPAVAWENAAGSLLERTLDDSANRRAILPNAFLATDEMLRRALRLVRGLALDRTAAERNLALWGTFAATEQLLMELVRAGADRQRMHEVLREHSMAAWEAVRRGEPNPLADSLAEDERIRAYLSPEQVRALMDAGGYVGNAPRRARALAAEIRHRLHTGGFCGG